MISLPAPLTFPIHRRCSPWEVLWTAVTFCTTSITRVFSTCVVYMHILPQTYSISEQPCVVQRASQELLLSQLQTAFSSNLRCNREIESLLHCMDKLLRGWYRTFKVGFDRSRIHGSIFVLQHWQVHPQPRLGAQTDAVPGRNGARYYVTCATCCGAHLFRFTNSWWSKCTPGCWHRCKS